jgi:hypothetical protein
MKVDEKKNSVIEYGSPEAKRDWFSNHTLSKEQYAQLVANKLHRAKVYQKLYSLK